MEAQAAQQQLGSRIPSLPTLINSLFPGPERPGGAESFYLKLETSILLDLQAPGAGGSGWLLRYLLNGNQGGEIAAAERPAIC